MDQTQFELLFFSRQINLIYGIMLLLLFIFHNSTFILFSVCVYIFTILILIVFFLETQKANI